METSIPTVRSDLLLDPSADEFRMLVDRLSLDDAAWATIPEVAIRVTMQPETERVAGPPWRVWPRTLGRGMARRRGPSTSRIGPFLFVSTSVQTDRVLGSIKQRLEVDTGTSEEPYFLPTLGPAELSAACACARRSRDTYRSWFGANAIGEPQALLEELTKVEIVRRRTLRAPLRSDGVKVLVAASQHNASTRAVLSAVTSMSSVSTCYVPHAPVADNSQYRDLPFHYALLRGEAEIDFYLSAGVEDGRRLRTVGLPGHQLAADDLIPKADHFVYAASPRAEEVLRSDVDVISRAIDGAVAVCLHPRSSASSSQTIFPPSWTVHPPGPTMPFLWTHGARAVIQHGSGLGLEAMASGAEVIDLCPRGDRPNYPYLAEPHAQVVSDSDELAAAVAALDARSSADHERRAFARSWMSVTDTPASLRAAGELLEIAQAPVPTSLLLDGWRPASER